jgi:hypothetical protein
MCPTTVLNCIHITVPMLKRYILNMFGTEEDRQARNCYNIATVSKADHSDGVWK